MRNIYSLKMGEKHMNAERKKEIRKYLEMECEESAGRKSGHAKTFRMKPAILAAAFALVFVVGGSVAFAHGKDIMEWIHGLGKNSEIAEQYVMTEVEAEYTEDIPWLTLQEAYVDGCMLVFTAKLTEGCEVLPQDISDHAMINGVDCRTDRFVSLGDGMYEGVIYVSDDLIGQDYSGQKLTVETELFVDPELVGANRKNFTFTIPGDTMNLVQKYVSEPIPLNSTDADGNVIVEGSVIAEYKIAPSRIYMTLTFTCTGENAKENLKKYIYPECEFDVTKEYIDYLVQDDKGNRSDMGYYCWGWSYTDKVETEEACSQGIEIEFDSFPCDSKTITFIPYIYHVDADGKPIFDVDDDGKIVIDEADICEERAFTIPLDYQN
ncbi:MAG: hypothetical protein ACI4L2_04065 [Wujia sp.]